MTKNESGDKDKNDRGSEEMKRGKTAKGDAKNDRGSVGGAGEETVVRVTEVELGGGAVEGAEKAEDSSAEVEAEENGPMGDSAKDGKLAEADTEENEEIGVVMPGEVGKPKRGGFWHRVNVLYPWLKFVATVLLVVAVLAGGFGVASLVHGRGTEQVADGDSNGGSGGNDDNGDSGGNGGSGSAQGDGSQGTEGDKDNQDGENAGGEGAKPGDSTTKPEEKPADGGIPAGGAGNSGGATGNSGTTVVPPTKPVVVPESATGKKLIALTFDDGPSPANTGRLLDILKAKNVKATFFVLGNLAERNPGLVQREEAEGHEVGSHTPYHNQQTKLSAAAIQAEATTMNQIFINVLGHSPVFTRPPYGSVNDNVRANLAQPLIIWSIDPEDWKYRDAATVRARVVGAAHDGAIALMHDIHATTVDAVAGIIDDLRAQGYEFLTVSELAKARGVTLQNGYSYYNFRP